MSSFPTEVAFTAAVKAEQTRLGSRENYARWEQKRGFGETITPDLAAFVAERGSFYLGTASADGRPYIQHRGGPPGFLKVLDERTLAFADFAGNRQYISTGNLSENAQAFIFLMDYTNQRRIKVWGRAEVVDEDTELLEELIDSAYGGRAERVIRFRVEAWDANCRQHIPRLVPAEDAADVGELLSRITELEAEVTALRQRLRGRDAEPEGAQAAPEVVFA